MDWWDDDYGAIRISETKKCTGMCYMRLFAFGLDLTCSGNGLERYTCIASHACNKKTWPCYGVCFYKHIPRVIAAATHLQLRVGRMPLLRPFIPNVQHPPATIRSETCEPSIIAGTVEY